MTVSIGVAHSPNDGRDFLSLLSQADKRLHSAKGGGRNQVIADSTASGEGRTDLVGQT